MVAKFTGSVIATPLGHQTAAGLPWVRFTVVLDNTDLGAETVRVSLQGPDVPDLAPRLTVGVRVFCRGHLRLRSWKNEAGGRRTGLDLSARKVTVIRERRPPTSSAE